MRSRPDVSLVVDTSKTSCDSKSRPGADKSQEVMARQACDRVAAREATRARLRQQLASADREVCAVASDNEANGREVADAEQAGAADLEASRLLRSSRVTPGRGDCCFVVWALAVVCTRHGIYVPVNKNIYEYSCISLLTAQPVPVLLHRTVQPQCDSQAAKRLVGSSTRQHI